MNKRDEADTARLDWLQGELETAARTGQLHDRLRELGLRYLIYRDVREAIDDARGQTQTE